MEYKENTLSLEKLEKRIAKLEKIEEFRLFVLRDLVGKLDTIQIERDKKIKEEAQKMDKKRSWWRIR